MGKTIFNEIPYSNPDLNCPGRGVEQWHDRNDVNVPVEGVSTKPYDVYYRFVATRIATATKGVYNWAYLDSLINDAIRNKQSFSFGIMTVYPDAGISAGLVEFPEGGFGCYPLWLHQAMQAESVKDWRTGNTWTPNYNSVHYLQWLLDLNTAVNNHINATSYNGVPYRNVINIIDIRGYGAWGEWHSGYTPNNDVRDYPAGTFPTIASLKKIVDAHVLGFPNFPLVCMIAAFDAGWFNNTKNPAEIAYYILTHPGNNWGKIGWRRDQWGATDEYLKDYLERNTRSFNGVVFNTLIMDRWKFAPITGEPPAWNPGDYFDLERQIKLYHAASFGNGNYGVTPNATIKERVRSASKACGYRFVISEVDIPPIVNNVLTINTGWRNAGNGTCYQNWDIVFELVGTTWKGISKHKLKLFLPKSTHDTITDTFTLTGIAAGTYQLLISVRDPNGYRVNMPLYIQGADASMRYSVGTVTVGTTTPPPNQGPVANAGGNIEITLPLNTARLTGSGTDPDGTITAYKWEQVSGPAASLPATINTAAISVSNLVAGTYTYKLTVTDDKGASHSDTVDVKVNPAVVQQKKVIGVKQVSRVLYDDSTSEDF